ncbi:serine/threonine-protein kinase [Nocardioides sp. TF02-7]|uniref:serine/threonine-protein kinase n=1 Tax=Nocardioides sp. TF02-7 TaxID=2917724 RepID=UPI001F05CAE5|nr:serine/threonine-protein kinase [Nocardioides sp. TF02-7]UMG94169.1 serine/threonine protein kinase [Nocardioides sp. TF02-7]
MTEASYADPSHRYRLDSRIATGGMGVVWRATDTRLDRPVAVKVLKHEYADDPQFRARFETEARNAAALQHPGIAGVYDYASDPAGTAAPYLVMELVEGQPLSALLAQARESDRRLDPDVVRDLLAQTAEALAVAHAAGIVHRDVKPANLIVTPDRRIKVTDFGIARAGDAAQITRTGAVMGTPQYLSPEQARGNPATPASDVYSLGVVAFECLAGRRPFEAESAVATALAHLQQPVPDLPPEVPADLAAVVRRALAKSPEERYADGAAFAAALRSPGSAAGAPDDPSDATMVLPAGGVPVPAPVDPATARVDRLDRPAPYEPPPADPEPGPDRKGRQPALAAAGARGAAARGGRGGGGDPAAGRWRRGGAGDRRAARSPPHVAGRGAGDHPDDRGATPGAGARPDHRGARDRAGRRRRLRRPRPVRRRGRAAAGRPERAAGRGGQPRRRGPRHRQRRLAHRRADRRRHRRRVVLGARAAASGRPGDRDLRAGDAGRDRDDGG